MILLLVISSVAAALVPVDRGTEEPTSSTATTGESAQAGGELRTETLRTGAPEPRVIELRLGDQLSLRVTSRAPDQVEIPDFGELADVDRDAPARFDLLPFEPGRYAVRLVDAGQVVGRIVVRPRGER